jgi:hypothetical protein
VRGKATKNQVKKASDAAWTYVASGYAAAAAAAADAAAAATDDDDAYDDAREAHLVKLADIVRARIPFEMVARAATKVTT